MNSAAWAGVAAEEAGDGGTNSAYANAASQKAVNH
jgi:hypothetical protein